MCEILLKTQMYILDNQMFDIMFKTQMYILDN